MIRVYEISYSSQMNIIGTLTYKLKGSDVRVFISELSWPLFMLKDIRRALGLNQCIAGLTYEYGPDHKRIVEIFTECDSEFVATISLAGLHRFVHDYRFEGKWVEELAKWINEIHDQVLADAKELNYQSDIGCIW